MARLRDEGVEAGRHEAARIIEEAHRRADDILESARREAVDTVGTARATAESELRAMREALRVAHRDTVLMLKEELTALLRDRLQVVMRDHLDRPEGLEALLDALLRMLPRDEATQAELSGAPLRNSDAGGALGPLLAQLLERGVVLKAGVLDATGLRLRWEGRGVELDMTDQALAEMLSGRLVTRFHDLLEGRSV